MKALPRALASLAAGLAHAAAIASPWDGQPQYWLHVLSMAALVLLLQWQPVEAGDEFQPRRAWRGAAWTGWLFALTWMGGSLWWLFISMHTYGGLPAPLAALAVLALAAALALFYAAACALFMALAPVHWTFRAIVFVACWTAAELARGTWLTGLPWGAGGYAQLDGPLIGYAPWLGVYGVGAMATALAAVAALASRGPWPSRIAAGLVIALIVGLPHAATQWGGRSQSGAAPPLNVALLQGNIPQDEKFIPGAGIATALNWYGEQLRDARATLVVTPETALPLLPRQLPPGYLEALAQRYATGQQAAVVGLPYENVKSAPGRYSNAALAFAPGATAPYRYDKQHLVPFGEFIPWGFRWFIDMMQIPLGDFARGVLPQPPLLWMGQRIALNICYEDLFGEEIGASFADTAAAPTLLLNMSNIAWFGDTVAIDQHLAISRMRALEFQRPMLRATNTGATALINHLGEVTHQLPRLTRGVLQVQVQGREGITPYAWWVSRWGLAPLWAFVLLVLLGGVLTRLRSQH